MKDPLVRKILERSRIFHRRQILLGIFILTACAYAEAAGPEAKGGASPALSTEQICEVDVFYSWKPKPPPPPPNTPAKPPEPIAAIETFYQRAFERGKELEATKSQLAARTSALKAGATKACRDEHQDQSNCVATRLRSSSRDYALLDFQTRKTLLDAVTEDCRIQAGTCLDAKVGEPQCREEKIATPGGTGAEGSAGEKEKKKK